MASQRKIITVVLAALLAGTAAQADMMPAQGPDVGGGPRHQVLPRAALSPSHSSPRWDRLVGMDSGSCARAVLPEQEQTRIEPSSEMPRVHVLADRQNGAGLCLCALLSLGLYKAAPCVKRLSWGTIPEWYHDGGPCRIDHGGVVTPDGLCPAVLHGLLPPDGRLDDPAPQYRDGILPSLWCKSQSSARLLAARGPPSRA